MSNLLNLVGKNHENCWALFLLQATIVQLGVSVRVWGGQGLGWGGGCGVGVTGGAVRVTRSQEGPFPPSLNPNPSSSTK